MKFNCLKCNVHVESSDKRKYCSKKCRLDHWYGLNSKRRVQKERLRRLSDPKTFARKRLKIRLKSLYNLTVEQFDARASKQNNVCAICSRICPSGRLLSVDHCHKTGKIRGLLCMRCNKALGLFDDNVLNISKAIEYLRTSLCE